MGRILITGGLGYVGGRVTRHLAKVHGLANLRVLSRRDLERVSPWAGSIEVVRGDLRDPAGLAKAVAGVYAVIHLAAPDEVMSRKDPEEALEVTGQGTHRLLQASLEAGVRRFLYFSTFHVYGPWARGRITEETATRPVHPYAITHRLAEDYVNWFRHEHGLETLVLRLSNAVGYASDPFVDRWTLVFNDLCRQAVLNGHLRLRSDGSQLRDFITLTDVARAVEHCLDLPDWGDGLLNLGSGRTLSVLELAEAVAAAYAELRGKPVGIERGPRRPGESTSAFEFCIDKLLATGFALRGSFLEETLGTFELIEQGVATGARLGQP
ncbi:MAG: nucleoside-diphosphate-sugar epimerase, UDP-glucose 4-epimerase [candidate division NC10 bacterium CSP1-5]|nr:MAG: nucleoside-diphosphate-sugar epimerase, UDP-glucose 4-epimerase [candidate division NC10 bacterium CSP1-5]